MKLASLQSPGRREGLLHVVSSDGTRAIPVSDGRFRTLISALDRWGEARQLLEALSNDLNTGMVRGAIELSGAHFLSPIPRAFNFVDGSAFINHVILVRKARGAEPPEDLRSIPLMYQHNGDGIVGPHDPIEIRDEAHGVDFEAEVAIVVDDVPMGIRAADAEHHIKLIMLCNDVSLRNLIPKELKAGFGFFHGKPCASFSPLAVTPDEFGQAWNRGKLHLNMRCTLNDTVLGTPSAGEMHFSFCELIEHAAKTKPLAAGTIIGSGTVSNEDRSTGVGCLAELRCLETIESGAPKTPFMKQGDVIQIDMLHNGRSVTGAIRQKVVVRK